MRFPVQTTLSLTIFAILSSPAAKASADNADEVQFDTTALRARGIDPGMADWFRQAPRFLPGDTTVTLTVNGNMKGKVQARFDDKGQLCADPEFVRKAGLLAAPGYLEKDTCFDLKQAWPQAEVNANPGESRVNLVVPQEAVASADPVNGNWEHGGTAGMFNYNAQFSGASGNGSDVRFGQLDSQAGFNAGDWIVRSHQTMTRFDGDATFDFQNAYAQRTFAQQKKVFQAGQISLSNSQFGTGQVLGFQFFPEAALQGKSAGAGVVDGIADTQSVVQVRQAGVLIYSTTVPAGPFHLQGIPLLNTQTDLQVTMTDTSGAQQRYTVPASSLLQNGAGQAPGLSFGAGKLDQDGSDLSPLLGTLATGWQLTPGSVLSAGVLGAQPYRAMAASLDTQPLPATTLSLQTTAARDAQHAQRGITGTASVSYKLSEQVGLSMNYSQQSPGYRELSDAVQYDETDTSGLNRRQTGVGINWSPPGVGSLSLTASQNTTFDGRRYTYFSGGWSRQFGRAYLGVALQHNVSTQRDNNDSDDDNDDNEDRLYVTLNIPFGKRSVTSYINSASDSSRAGLRYSDRSGQDKGWSLATERDFNDYSNSVTGSADMVTPASQLSGSLGRDGQTTNWSTQASGSLVAHKHGITLSPYQIGDTFGIAKVGDEGGVRIDTPTGPTWTDNRGYAVLPSLGNYQKSTVQVDTRSLAKNADINNAWQETDTARGAVTYVNFGVVKTRRALIDVKDAQGRPLPHGASVFDANGNFITVVGDNGEVFVPDTHPGALLDVQQSGSTICHFTVKIPEEADLSGLYETTQAICR